MDQKGEKILWWKDAGKKTELTCESCIILTWICFGLIWLFLNCFPHSLKFSVKIFLLSVLKCGVQFGTWLARIFVLVARGCCLWKIFYYLCSLLYTVLFMGWPGKLHNLRDKRKPCRKLPPLGCLRKVCINFWRVWQAASRALKRSDFLGNEYHTLNNPSLKDREPTCNCCLYHGCIWANCFFTFCL